MLSHLRKSLIAIAVLAAAIAATAGAASAAVPISGNPMTVYVGPQGQLQAFLSGSAKGIYFDPEEQLGDAGLFLAFPESGTAPVGLKGHVWGFRSSFVGPDLEDEFEPTGIGQGPVTGTGSPVDPFSQLTEYKAGQVKVAQTTTYVNGATEFRLKWVVTNTGAPLNFRALAAADFYFEGDDHGTGIFTAGPPRFIGGTNVDSGRSGGLVEVGSSPWSHYQELAFPDIWIDKIEEAATLTPSVFNDTVEAEDVDNAGGVEWDQFETTLLGTGKSATFELIARTAVPSALQLEPTNAGSPQGVPIGITATALDSVGLPYAGRTLRYAITGANVGTGALTLDAAGKTVITDPGTNAGFDTIAAFVDFNGNGVRDASEPQASALATFVDSIPPSCKVSVKGDRPGGKGGPGSALVITVNCGETVTMSAATTLTLPPTPAKKSHARISKERKGKKKTVKLKVTKATIQPGVTELFAVKVPKQITSRYAGRTLKAKVVATIKDGAGNVSKAEKTSPIKIAAAKKGKHLTGQ